jgi:probable dihydroxyacetone kinase regulator
MSDSQITKNALASAIKKLMKQEPLEKISVIQIVQLCGLNRKSFYYHFRNKYQLIEWIFYDELSSRINRQKSDTLGPTMATICNYLYDNKSFYRNAMHASEHNLFTACFTEIIQKIIRTDLENLLCGKEYRTFHSIFFADAMCMAVSRWLQEEPMIPPDRFLAGIRSSLQIIAEKVSPEMSATGQDTRDTTG